MISALTRLLRRIECPTESADHNHATAAPLEKKYADTKYGIYTSLCRASV